MSTYQRKLESANGGRDVEFPESVLSVLPLFLQAHDYAHGLGRDVWDFALELGQLMGSGLTRNDIRWLICKGYVEHSQEIMAKNKATRTFAACSGLRFTQHSCFVLTQQGMLLARRLVAYGMLGRDCGLLDQYSNPPHDEPPTSSRRSDNSGVKKLLEEGHHRQRRPTWNEVRRELKVNGILVKRFRVPAPNQQLVLAVFQESDWFEHVDDPLPPSLDVDPKVRLHSTINGLNRNQKNPLVRFHGNGSGDGIYWQFNQSGTASRRSKP